jgi:hypothetical protein
MLIFCSKKAANPLCPESNNFSYFSFLHRNFTTALQETSNPVLGVLSIFSLPVLNNVSPLCELLRGCLEEHQAIEEVPVLHAHRGAHAIRQQTHLAAKKNIEEASSPCACNYATTLPMRMVHFSC